MKYKKAVVFLIAHEQAELCSGGLKSDKMLPQIRWFDEIKDSLDKWNEVFFFFYFRKAFEIIHSYCRTNRKYLGIGKLDTENII